MKKIVLQVAAVALYIGGLFAMGVAEADDSMQVVTYCKTPIPYASGECNAPYLIVCCLITSGPAQGLYFKGFD